MAVKALIFGTDDLYPHLRPFYDKQVQQGNIEIVGCGYIENNKLKIYSENNLTGGGDFDIAILSTTESFYDRMKFLESQGIPRRNIIDGRIFRVHELDFPRFLDEGVAYGVLSNREGNAFIFKGIYRTHPSVYFGDNLENNKVVLKMGEYSYISNSKIEVPKYYSAELNIEKFTGIGWDITFELALNARHNSRNVFQNPATFTWSISQNFLPMFNGGKIEIGNDVWIGRGCCLKNSNPNKPLIIGDGAVVASDSVVVKSVPPYAIVGGNPAQIIKYRFPEKIIESLLRIKWWDWDLDKIHDNFKYFNDIEKFVELHDKGV